MLIFKKRQVKHYVYIMSIKKQSEQQIYGRNGFCNEKKVGTVSEDKVQFGGRPIADNRIFYPNSKYYDANLSDYGLSNWKVHLASNPLKVMTYLDTPIETDLTQEEIQDYQSLVTYDRTTIVENDAECYTKITYMAKGN